MRQTKMFQTNQVAVIDQTEIGQSIVDRFEQQVAQYPQKIAVKSKDHTFTYEAINQTANRLARMILEAQGESDAPVPILLKHNSPVIMALLAVLKTGRSYVALDPTFPKARLEFMLNDLQAKVLITDDQHLALATEIAQNSCNLLSINQISVNIPDTNLGLEINPDTYAAIFYTSGSTGQPKGVIRNHKIILHRAWLETNNFNLSSRDRVALLFSCGFGASANDIFVTLLNGGTLCLLDPKTAGPHQIINWLNEEDLTYFHPPVTLLRQLFELNSGTNNFPALRYLVLGGQRIYKKDVDQFQQQFSPDCKLVHRLSTSEISMFCYIVIDHNTELTSEIVPVGYPTPGKEILILDDEGNDVGFNAIGEIVVRNHQPAPGYWRRPDLTKQVFIPDPTNSNYQLYHTGDLGRLRPDGCLEQLGRKDSQVKIRGFRIELAAIEAALNNLETIKEAVVAVKEDKYGQPDLVAYFVAKAQATVLINELRDALAQSLPEYMLPSRYIVLDKFLLTATGKIDRKALPEVGNLRPALSTPYVPPQNSLQAKVAMIWTNVLEIDQIGIHDNFWHLGGQSLSAARLVARLNDEFQVALNLHHIFEQPTVAALGKFIDDLQNSRQSVSLAKLDKTNLEDSLRLLGYS